MVPALRKHMSLVISLFCLLCTSPSFAALLLQHVRDVSLPGPPSRFDYASLDSGTGLLYLNHMDAGDVLIFDTRTNQVVTVLKGFPRCTGILVVPSLSRAFVSTPGSGQVAVLDTKSRKVLARLPAGRFPDGIAYEPETRRVFVSDEAGRAVTVMDAVNLKVIARIPLGGEAGNTQVDSQSHLLYTNDQTHGDLVQIDPVALRIRKRIPLGVKGNHGLYIDSKHALAFIASETANTLSVLDLARNRVKQRFPVGEEPDVLSFDPGSQRLYVASESGVVSLFESRNFGLRKEGDIRVGPNAHVVVADPRTHLVYFPLKSVNGSPKLRIMK